MTVIATRFYNRTNSKRINVLKNFIERAKKCAEYVLVAVNNEADVTNALEVVNEELRIPGVRAFPVTPWNHPTMPLNSLVLEAAKLGAGRILFASAEVEITPEIVKALDQEMINEKRLIYSLVVGAVMKGHHHMPLIRQPLHADAYTVPWNTCALWNLDLLSLTGFPLVSNTPFYPNQIWAGSEELVTISLHQKLKPRITAILKKIAGGVKWNTVGFDTERKRTHEEKIGYKNEKAMYQLERFRGLQRPRVIHI